jgi:hypothetical protein
MNKFEIKPILRSNNPNLTQTEKLLKLLSKLLYNGDHLAVEFNKQGRPRITKRWFKNGWHSADLWLVLLYNKSMTELEALKEKVELLQKIIDTQAQLIQEMRKANPLPVISIPSIWSVPCQHEYPSPWFGTVPPACKKCGEMAPAYTVTCSV